MWIAKEKRDELWDSINKVTAEYFAQKIGELHAKELARCMCRGRGTPRRRLLCTHEREYLGEAYMYMIRVLLMLRDNEAIFEYFEGLIDANSSSLDDAFLDFLADDIIFFLLADFGSHEKPATNCLCHLRNLIKVPPCCHKSLLVTICELQSSREDGGAAEGRDLC